MKDDLVKWYLNLDGYSKEEFAKINTLREDPGVENEEKFLELSQQFIDRMPFSNLNVNDVYIRFGESASYLIREIFKKEVDDDTLVITTTYEHTTVRECLTHCKNTYEFEKEKIMNYSFDDVIMLSKKYEKVFVYMIGTNLSTGEITPQLFFEQLKQELTRHNIKHKILIDDVHGMFITPRDYRIFDYVIYTAHALVPMYDMGLVISKTDDIGFKCYNWGVNYLERMDIVLKRKAKLMMFRNIMFQLLNKLFSNKKYFRYFNYTTNHIFAVETTGIYYTPEEYDILHDYKIRVAKDPVYVSWIRIRYQEFVKHDEKTALEALHYLENLIKRKIMIMEMKE